MADANTSALDLPFDAAIRFFRDKASLTTRSWTDVYAAAHSRAFVVAGAATDALVADFRQEIAKALEKGTTLAEFRGAFDDIVKRNGWDHTGSRNWRSRIIFDTNLRTAYAAGRYAQLTEPDTLEAFPYWQYNHSGALHPRKEHLSWDGKVLRADDPFWATNYPPNGWHCGCFPTAVSDRDLKRQGKRGPDPSPDLLFRAEEVGGKRVMVPFGVDPGFEYNPGQAWLSRTLPGSETVAAAPGMIERFAKMAVGGQWPGNSWVPAALTPRRLAGPWASMWPARSGCRPTPSAPTSSTATRRPSFTGPRRTSCRKGRTDRTRRRAIVAACHDRRRALRGRAQGCAPPEWRRGLSAFAKAHQRPPDRAVARRGKGADRKMKNAPEWPEIPPKSRRTASCSAHRQYRPGAGLRQA